MHTPEHKEFSIIDAIVAGRNLLKYLFTRWLLILLVAIAGGLAGVLYAWLQKPQYIAVITFFTEGDTKSGLGVYASLAAQFGFDLGTGGGGAFEGDNLMEILRSKTLVEKTLLSHVDKNSKELMIERYLSSGEFIKNWREDEKYRNLKFAEYPVAPDRLRDSVTDKIYENIVKADLKIDKRDKKVDLIDVQMKSVDEYFAKRFVELLTENAIKYYTDYKVKNTRQNVEILQRQTDSVKLMLFGNIGQVAEMNDINVNPLRQTVRIGVQRKQIDLQANSALYVELLKNLELSKLALRKATPLIQVVDQPSLPLKKEKPGRLLTGIIFAFIAAFLCMLYLLIKRWLIQNKVIATYQP